MFINIIQVDCAKTEISILFTSYHCLITHFVCYFHSTSYTITAFKSVLIVNCYIQNTDIFYNKCLMLVYIFSEYFLTFSNCQIQNVLLVLCYVGDILPSDVRHSKIICYCIRFLLSDKNFTTTMLYS